MNDRSSISCFLCDNPAGDDAVQVSHDAAGRVQVCIACYGKIRRSGEEGIPARSGVLRTKQFDFNEPDLSGEAPALLLAPQPPDLDGEERAAYAIALAGVLAALNDPPRPLFGISFTQQFDHLLRSLDSFSSSAATKVRALHERRQRPLPTQIINGWFVVLTPTSKHFRYEVYALDATGWLTEWRAFRIKRNALRFAKETPTPTEQKEG